MNRQLYNRTIDVNGVTIFYREAGDSNAPALLLLHGFPTSSVMFKNLMTLLSDRYHLIAPDYPGFGFSDFPAMDKFDYSFENIADCIEQFTAAIGLNSFTIYLHDYGAAVGLPICVKSPRKINGIIVQNGNAYMEGLGTIWDEVREFWEHPTAAKKKKLYAFLSREGTKEQYYAGLTKELKERVSPETWILDWERMSRPGNLDMQFYLNCTYKRHIERFPLYREYFRRHQPPAVVIWGKHDVYFDAAEAPCYKRDLPAASIHLLEAGHMALETNFDEVTAIISNFMASR